MRHQDPRPPRRHRAPDVDHLAAAVRLDLSLQEMRDRQPERPDDEPPTGLIDLDAIRARLGQPTLGEPDPAAAAWLAGGADPTSQRMLERVDRLEPAEPDDVTFGELFERQQAPRWEAAPADEGFVVDLESMRDALDGTPSEPVPTVIPREHLVHHIAAEQLAAAGIDVEVVHELPDHITVDVGEPEPVCGHVGPSGTSCIDPPDHGGSHGDGSIARWIVREPFAVDVGEPVPVAPWPRVAPAFSTEHGGRRLDWRSRHDPRSLSYGVRAALPAPAPLADRLWHVGPVLDQGAEGECVGFGLVDAINARAGTDVDHTAADARVLFARADVLDGDGHRGEGTSVLAGLQAAVERGWIGGYRWCFGTRDVAAAVSQLGPVVVGVPWLSGMYETGPGGLVKVEGDDIGIGHCLAVVGVLLRGPQGQAGPWFVWQNSWGADYGDGGLGYVHHRDLARLLHGVGEAALTTLEVQRP
jgi:hypothetical protein